MTRLIRLCICQHPQRNHSKDLGGACALCDCKKFLLYEERVES